MRKFVFQFAACIAAVIIAVLFLPGVTAGDYNLAILAGVFLATVYFMLRPIARILLGIVNLLTLGFVGFMIDSALVYGITKLFPKGFQVQNFLWAMATAAIVDGLRAFAGRAAHK